MIEKAKRLLDEGGYTCVLCGAGGTLTARERGVKPLADWLQNGVLLHGFCAADKVVGKATAFLYCMLEVRSVYGRVMSAPALQVLQSHGITAQYDTLVEHIVNRAGDGICPFEQAVWDVTEPEEAWQKIRQKLDR